MMRKSRGLTMLSAFIFALGLLAGANTLWPAASGHPSVVLSFGGTGQAPNNAESAPRPVLYPPVGKTMPSRPIFMPPPLVRGLPGDLWADTIIGKPRFSEVNPFTTTGGKLFWAHGVIVDRTVSSNRLYIYDSGNSRILGLNLAQCLAHPGYIRNCTADIVIGQPDVFHSGCNGDSGYQGYPQRAPASATTLCGQQEAQLSIAEGGAGSSMAIDGQGNLYVTDFFNHRVLKYLSPFTTDRVADAVWGQDSFTGNQCNKGQLQPTDTSLCFSWGDTNNWTAGVDIDGSGNLWVVDSGNNRVLRFAPGSHQANLVLGQPSFTSSTPGAALNQLHDPAAVRLSPQGALFVADEANDRVLVYDPPFVSGMASRVFGSGFAKPTSLDFDPVRGGVWILNSHEQTWPPPTTLERWDAVTQTRLEILGSPSGGPLAWATGSVGIDSQGHLLVIPGWYANNDVVVFDPAGAPTLPIAQLFDGQFVGNEITARGIAGAAGVAVSDNQLVVADYGRLLFWNNPLSLTSGQPADGVTGGVSDFSQRIQGCCLYLQPDLAHHLWTITGDGGLPDQVQVYSLPLSTGAQPILTLTLPLPVLGGGMLTGPDDGSSHPFRGVAPTANSDFVWISHPDTNRVFRVRNPLTAPQVDVILGQVDLLGTQCNRGAPAVTGARPDTLCKPGAVALDRFGNLFVSDHTLEALGNFRLLEFDHSLFPSNNAAVMFAPAATKIFPNIATWQPAFDIQNRMVVGYNPYINPDEGWFPGVYNNPLGPGTTPDARLNDYHSMAFSTTFDDFSNLYVGDLDRSRVLIYRNPFGNPTPTATPTPPCMISFSDVHPADYFYTPVQYLACHGAISGYADGTFRPGADTTRGQLTKIVVLAHGWPVTTSGGPHFTDVPTANPFYSFIETAYQRGIISGYADGTFRWGSNVTRGQLSKIITLAEGWRADTSGGPHFIDVPAANPFYSFIETAYHHSIISGYSDRTFRPGNSATRGQIAKMVYNAITAQVVPPSSVPGTSTPTRTATRTPTRTPTPTPTASPTCAPAWHEVAGADPGSSADDELWAVGAVSSADVWAVGHYRVGGGPVQTLIERWNGTTWVQVASPNTNGDNYLKGLAVVGPNDIWAVGSNGQTLIEHWNGTSWSIVPSPNSGSGFNTLYSVAASSSSDVWAVGAYDSGAGVRTLTLHWDGNSWNTVPSPNPPGGYNEFYGVATAGPNDAWAVGYYNYNSAVYTLIAHWNGTSWTVVPSPAVSGSANLTAVGIAGPNDVWAVGGVDYWGQALIEHWNGSAWSVVANPTAGRLTGLAIRNSADIWAAGDFPSSASSTFTEHWDGSTWTVVPSPNNGANDNSLRGLTVAPAREAWSVGFYGADGAHAPLIERYYVSCTGLMPNLHESVSLNPLPTPTQTPNALGSRHK